MQPYPEVIKVFQLPNCFKSAVGIQRCVLKDTEYMPANFVSKTHNGYANLLQNLIRSSRRFAADVLQADASKKYATDTVDDFWFIYEVPLIEGEAGINTAFRVGKELLTQSLASGIVAANISYAVALGSSIVVFLWIFGSVRKGIQLETKYNRGGNLFILSVYSRYLVLYIIPNDVLRNTKAVIEYVETLHAALSVA